LSVGCVLGSSPCFQELTFMKTLSKKEVNENYQILRKLIVKIKKNIAVTKQFIAMSLANLTIFKLKMRFESISD
jgi:hypothetical protein